MDLLLEIVLSSEPIAARANESDGVLDPSPPDHFRGDLDGNVRSVRTDEMDLEGGLLLV